MSYRIEGDGSYNNTKIWQEGELIEWNHCRIIINPERYYAIVDGEPNPLSRIVLLGIYQIVGDGSYSNTRLFVGETFIHGVQQVCLDIDSSCHTKMTLDAIWLPNLVEDDGV